jgi:CDP-diacylglycerol--glycerol-3-phosphate 3-phosphatidyltransferase
MNLPNKLTLMRIALTPVFMAAMLVEFPHHYLVALILFIIASITDWLDGYLARKNNQVTNFGKFCDPLADKMLTTAAFLAFMAKGWGIGIEWVLFIVLLREFAVSALRLVVVTSNAKKVIAANIWGKMKTVSQMVSIIVGIALLYCLDWNTDSAFFTTMNWLFTPILWISTALAVISGLIYVKESWTYINPSC